MKPRLPRWVSDPVEGLRREVAPYRSMSPEERGALVGMACRDAMRLVAARADRDELLRLRDPLPESSARALARLRREHRELDRMPSEIDPLELALKLATLLEARSVPYAIGGALAYGLWGVPRAIVDIDLNVFVETDAFRLPARCDLQYPPTPTSVTPGCQTWP